MTLDAAETVLGCFLALIGLSMAIPRGIMMGEEGNGGSGMKN
jgi:hypothetical protein